MYTCYECRDGFLQIDCGSCADRYHQEKHGHEAYPDDE